MNGHGVLCQNGYKQKVKYFEGISLGNKLKGKSKTKNKSKDKSLSRTQKRTPKKTGTLDTSTAKKQKPHLNFSK